MESRSQRYNCGKRYMRSRYERKLEPWEYRMPTWMFLGVAGVFLWLAVKIVYLIFS